MRRKGWIALAAAWLVGATALASVTVTVNGTNYTIPQNNEKGWGTNVTSWIQAISANTIQPSGGLFSLTSDLDFGPNFGIISKYYKSRSSNIAASGILRLANTDAIAFRNSGNTADLLLTPGADGILNYGSSALDTINAAQTLSNKSLVDANDLWVNSSDATKKLAWSLGAQTTGTTLTLATNQSTSQTLNLPNVAAGDSIVTLNTTQTLTNKSISGSTNTLTNVPASSLTGQVSVSNGGTGLGTLTNHGVIVGAGTSNVTQLVGSSGTLLSGQGASADPSFSATPTLGVAGTTSGSLSLANGNTSGAAVTIQNTGATSAWNFNLPSTAGSAGSVLTSQGGGSSLMTWTTPLTNPMNALGDMIVGGASGAANRLAGVTTPNISYLTQTGTGSASAIQVWTTWIPPSFQKFTSGSGTYFPSITFVVTSANATAGATYTNNAITFTVEQTISSGTILEMSPSTTGSPSGTTLTKASGTGDATITFSAFYTPRVLHVRAVGGGGGGSGSGSGAGNGGNGGNTTFGTSLLVANGGGGSAVNSVTGGTGGTASLGTGPTGIALQGGTGQSCTTSNSTGTSLLGGEGAVSPFGGAGAGSGSSNVGNAGSAVANSGSGGGGAGGTATTTFGGVGGGAGGYVDAFINSPATSYAYAVGAGGTAGTAGTSGFSGGTGGSGVILVQEIYQ